VNCAIAVLYARRLLVELCAHWPKVTADQPMTLLAALGCSDEQHLPFVLDLLYAEQLKSKLQPVCLLWNFFCYKFVSSLLQYFSYSISVTVFQFLVGLQKNMWL